MNDYKFIYVYFSIQLFPFFSSLSVRLLLICVMRATWMRVTQQMEFTFYAENLTFVQSFFFVFCLVLYGFKNRRKKERERAQASRVPIGCMHNG